MFRFPQSNFDVHSSVLPRIAMPLLAGLLLFGMNISQPRADDRLGPHEFIIPASDGYGTSECLSQQSACGQVIADAWCASHGMPHALGYSKAEDVTGVIKLNMPSLKIPQDAIIVSCGR